MCAWGTTVPVWVRVPADLSHTGRERWKLAQIDSCIADRVAALQAAGVRTRSSCCGHGKAPAEIMLDDCGCNCHRSDPPDDTCGCCAGRVRRG